MASEGRKGPRPPRLNFERRILLRTLLLWLPTFAVMIILLWVNDYSGQTRWTAVILLGLFALAMAFSLRDFVLRPLQTVSNMLSAIRKEDFSFRARGGTHEDALGELVLEVNALSEMMRQRRLGAMEAIALMKQVMMEIDVAVFTFDAKQRLKMINPAGEQLIAMPSERAVNRTATELGLADYLNAGGRKTLQTSFPGKQGRWLIQTRGFREAGVPHSLLLISDLSNALREEERLAWQRLTRVLGHELNNSLAPIKSIASTLKMLVSREELASDWRTDARRGLDVIESRADALARFMQGYTRLARLPAPNIQEMELRPLLERIAAADGRLPVEVRRGPDITLKGDSDQLGQVVINLVKNAIEASMPTGGKVQLGWKASNGDVVIEVIDEGEGLSSTSNLFVPFFTTKPGGSGIGLALSRQIAESHNGTLTLENRRDRLGCIATLRIPAA
jgi:two-component system, NtrC family, nitrogen regulation sensor histidine kinase NtrY